ncbi:serine hydrolase domain-containing protein [Bradyrhizobium canariense]|uniref:CubicO group peptidase, beta-lactamase class C family n=1 Tax=Bradyrhizobium canariense TaxID=255045 RepID=A0A1H1MS21_9BRAD|nr:serine hydrolase domain-containing protein [Bradyrhizobium canariense]SDR89460.1 CubicO group peptidase, beta-lactamase class C family [Bradyrhizobium canariense]
MKRWRTDGAARRAGVAVALALLIVATAGRAEPPLSYSVSFSHAGLERVSDYMRNEVATGKIPGAIVLIQQHGRPVYFEKFGVLDVESKRPMAEDAIFRLYSMSKPITSVAAMMLVEDGKLALDDPLSKYIPAFADVKVGVEEPNESGKPALALEPLKRPITIEDLLRHTSGLTYGFYGDSAVRKLYANSDLFKGDFDNAEFADRLAKLPLAEQPGTLWDYGHSTDVLGRVIEVVSGKSLFQFEKERLLDPLGMRETAFYVADEAKRPRIAEPMPNDRFTSPIAGIRNPMLKRRWESGGAGMVGTTGDYVRFAQMLLNGGTLDGRRYLKPETVALMTSDHIGPETKIARDYFYFPGADSGFGLGFAVRTMQPPNTPLPLGEYRWDGVAGTFFFIDPKDDMFVICMMQTPSQRGRIETEVKTLVYDALGN